MDASCKSPASTFHQPQSWRRPSSFKLQVGKKHICPLILNTERGPHNFLHFNDLMNGLDSTVELPVALMVESILYGIFLITFFACLQRLLWNKDTWKSVCDINFRLLSVVILLFTFSSLNQALELFGVIQTFAYAVNGTQQKQDEFVAILKASSLWSMKSSLLMGCFCSGHASDLSDFAY
jgi:hypothetical protein